MSYLYRLSKEELIERIEDLQSENESLQDEIDRLNDCYADMENELADKINSLDATDIIKDVDWFKYRLQLDNLLTPELEKFIEDYLKFNNIVKG